MIIFLVFLLGIIIGSFLNVCIYRIPEGLSIVKPRSRCGTCGHELGTLDLVPLLSYIFLRGKCRYCKSHIALRYPIIEALTGFLYVVVYLAFGYSLSTLVGWILFSILIVALMTDIDHMIIPDKLIIFGLVVGLAVSILQVFRPLMIFRTAWHFSGFAGGAATGGILLLIAIISMFFYGEEGGMGMGDVKLFVVIGLLSGLKVALMSLWLSFIIGGLAGVVLILVFKKNRKMAIPFGPAIVIATMISVLFYSPIIQVIFG